MLQNDLYRLQILIPLLELLHHHAINQDDIQYTAVMVAERFAPYLLRPSGCAVKQARQDRLVVAAATSMVLDYRSLFLHSVLDQDRYANSHMLTPRAIHVPRHRPTSVYAAVSYLMPMPPKSAPVSMHNINSEPEDFCKVGTDLYLTSSDLSHDSPYSDDLDSAFSGSSCASISSRDGDNHRQVLANQGIDNELDAAVHSLFCASTADLLIPI